MPQEVFIDAVLTISKEELRYLKSQNEEKIFTTNWKEMSGQTLFLYCFRLIFGNGKLSALLTVCHENNSNVDGNIVFCVKNSKFTVRKNKSCEVLPKYINTGLSSWSNEFHLNDVLNPKNKFIKDGNLIVHARGIVYYTSAQTYQTVKYTRGNADKDFIISVGKEEEPKTEIMVHKCVLASRSPVFDRMLQTNMKEKTENKLDIIDFDVEVVQAAVEYFYDSKAFTFLNLEQLINLLQFSDKYEIHDMKGIIQEVLLRQIYPDTLVLITNASIIFNSTMLKEFCIRCFILFLKNEISFDNAGFLDEDFKKYLEENQLFPHKN